MAHEENLSVGVFIDGGYYAKINEGLNVKNVNLKALLDFIRRKILCTDIFMYLFAPFFVHSFKFGVFLRKIMIFVIALAECWKSKVEFFKLC